jgi:sec-independent protein translocase protein TatA
VTGVAIVSPVPFGGGIGPWEIVLLVVLAMLLFGAKKLPEIGRSAGKGMREFKDSVTDFKKPVEDVKELVTIDEVKDLAALRNPRKALTKVLTDEPSTETRTEA